MPANPETARRVHLTENRSNGAKPHASGESRANDEPNSKGRLTPEQEARRRRIIDGINKSQRFTPQRITRPI